MIEHAAIVAHNEVLIAGCTEALVSLRLIPRRDRNATTEAQITYWKNARSAFKWSTRIADQRHKGLNDVHG